MRAIAAVRQQALQEDRPVFTPQALRRALATFSSGTAIGLDGLDFRMLSSMPAPGWTQLCHLLGEIVGSVALPPQQLNVLLALLPKKAGGFRTIAICPSIYRLVLRLVGAQFRKWDQGIQPQQG